MQARRISMPTRQPATATSRTILIDTSSERYAANPANDIQTWEDALLNGKADTVDGVVRSVRQFYEEVSYNNLHVTGTVFGPVQLPGSWDDYFEAEPTSVGDADPFETYNPKAGYYEAAIAAAQDLVDFSQFQFIACVVKSFLSGAPQKYRAARESVQPRPPKRTPREIRYVPGESARCSRCRSIGRPCARTGRSPIR